MNAQRGFVVRRGEGERLPGGPPGAKEIIKVSRAVGSHRIGMVMSPMPPGQRIGIHLHERDDEAFFVARGRGVFILDDERIPVEEGDVVFIPEGVWHGFENGDQTTDLLWVDSPPNYVDLHRRFFSGEPEPEPAEAARLFRDNGFRTQDGG